MIRPARNEDRSTVEAVVNAAYEGYIARIGRPPGPMLDDYGRLIADGCVSVFAGPDGAVAGVLVLLAKPDHLLLDNIAVRPEWQGRGIGRTLIAFAESAALRQGCAEIRLYTHEKMTENIALYKKLGFVETGRGHEAGYDRVFMAKRLERP